MKLLASLLLACALPAQVSLYNLSIPVGVQATVIDWQGKPALCLVRWGPGSMFNLRNPSWYPINTQRVELTVAGVGVWDFRPCAANGTYWLAPDYETQFLTCGLPPSGLNITTAWTNPVKIDGRLMNNFVYDFRSVKCPGTVWIRTTKCLDEFPEGACLVMTLAVK